ncbi:MAG: glyoxalase/bleomycin resistance protein/dioxygenase [Myxococcales bacterium]|nr:glyoxalase/bleomycin resistance protein/dioxygenase [Myxococcales bacterium]
MGGIHHIILCVKDLERSRAAYGRLMPELGFGKRDDYGGTTGWTAERSRLWIRAEDPKFAAELFSKDRVGLCEVAFEAESRAAVDRVAREVEGWGFRLLHAAAEYSYSPGYYAVFFSDPDGIKLEVAHVP